MELYIIFIVSLRSFVVPALFFQGAMKRFDKLAWSELSLETTSLAVKSCSLEKFEGKGPTVLLHQNSPLSSP